MLYVYYGSDISLVREKAFSFLHTLMKEDTSVTYITPDIYEEGMIIDSAEAVSLFGGEHVFVIDTPSEKPEVFSSVLEKLALMRDSVNHFILIEGALLAAPKKKLEVGASSIEEFVKEKTTKFNAFSLTDAFTRRDKKSLWLLLTEAWSEGLSNEEIVGILFWQVKILRLVERTKSADEAGQKPFVYQKAKQALRNFKQGELDRLSQELVTIYHEGHGGKRDMTTALEGWVLSL